MLVQVGDSEVALEVRSGWSMEETRGQLSDQFQSHSFNVDSEVAVGDLAASARGGGEGHTPIVITSYMGLTCPGSNPGTV